MEAPRRAIPENATEVHSPALPSICRHKSGKSSISTASSEIQKLKEDITYKLNLMVHITEMATVSIFLWQETIKFN